MLCETAWVDAVQQEEAAADVEQRAAIIKGGDAPIGMATGKSAKEKVYSVRASGRGRRAVIIECITELGAVKGSRCVWVVEVATGDYHSPSDRGRGPTRGYKSQSGPRAVCEAPSETAPRCRFDWWEGREMPGIRRGRRRRRLRRWKISGGGSS